MPKKVKKSLPKKVKKSNELMEPLPKRLIFPSLVTGVRSMDKKAIEQFKELLLIEWGPPPPETLGIEVKSFPEFLMMARKGKESVAARFLKKIVRGCSPSGSNTNDLVAIDDKLCNQFEDFYSNEFTSLGLVLAGVWSDHKTLQLSATKKFREVILDDDLCPAEPPFILEYGIVPRFDEFLEREDSPDLQTEAALALLDIGSTAWMDRKLVWLDLDMVKYLLKFLDFPSSDVRDKAVLLLGELAETREGRDLVHQREALRPLLDKVLRPLLDELDKNDKLLPMLRNATHTLLRFCKGRDRPGEFEDEVTKNKYGTLIVHKPVVVVFPPHPDKVIPAIRELYDLVGLIDEEVLTNACSVLACLTDSRYCKTRVIIDDAVCRRLVELLKHESPSVVSPVLCTLGNIVLRKDIQSQRIVDFGILPCLWKLLTKNIKEWKVWEIMRSLTNGKNRWIEAAQIKNTNSQFCDEIEGKKKEVKETLEQYDDLQLSFIRLQLSIPACDFSPTKDEMVSKLMGFLEGHGATTVELHAEKEQSSKVKKRTRESEQEKDANEEEPEEETAKKGVPERSAEKMSGSNPSDEELCNAIGEILKRIDFKPELSDLMERLGKRFGIDFTPKKMHIRIMYGYQLTRLSAEDEQFG